MHCYLQLAPRRLALKYTSAALRVHDLPERCAFSPSRVLLALPCALQVGKRDVCEDTAYLKMSNHIFGGQSREAGALTMDQIKEQRRGKF